MSSIVPPPTDTQLAPPPWFAYPFPPIFWSRLSIRALSPQLVYAGPMPLTDGDALRIQGWARRSAYVYVLLDDEWDALYVGKTVNLTGRFSKHRSQKPWWNQCSSLFLLGVDGDDRRDAETAAFRVESIAIRDIRPRYNIAGVDWR